MHNVLILLLAFAPMTFIGLFLMLRLLNEPLPELPVSVIPLSHAHLAVIPISQAQFCSSCDMIYNFYDTVGDCRCPACGAVYSVFPISRCLAWARFQDDKYPPPFFGGEEARDDKMGTGAFRDKNRPNRKVGFKRWHSCSAGDTGQRD